MGRTSPIILRSGHLFNNWKSHWFSDSNYTSLLTEDLRIRYYINNVHYYLKLPSSDLSIRRPQNRIGIMYHSVYLPEYLRVEKIMPYRFNFFRFSSGVFSSFHSLSLNGTLGNSMSKSTFNLLFSAYENSLKCKVDTLLLKNYFILGLLTITKKLYVVNSFNYSRILIRDLFNSNILHLLYLKTLYNLYYHHSEFINKLQFKRSVTDKYFNKKFNLTSLFRIISTEDILINNDQKGTKGILNQVKRKSYTARSIMLLDSFGKYYDYLPQRSRRKFPFYDFIYFYKVNFLSLFKLYSNHHFFKHKKKKRRYRGKKLRKKYFVKAINNTKHKIYQFKLVLAHLLKLSNLLIILSKNINLKCNTYLNQYYLNNKLFQNIYSSKIEPRNFYLKLLHKAYFKKLKGIKTKNRKLKFLIDLFNHDKPFKSKINKKYYTQSVVRLVNKIANSNNIWKKQLDFNKKILFTSVKLGNIFNYLDLDNDFSIQLPQTPKYNFLNSSTALQTVFGNLMAHKRKIYELLDCLWTSLQKSYKLIVSKFRKLKINKSKYYLNFRKKHYLSSYMNNQWLVNQTTLNLDSLNNYYNYSNQLHPIYHWIKELMDPINAYKNKLTNYNRYFLNKRMPLNHLGKNSFYYIRLRKRRKRKIDKFDIRYIPRGWHDNRTNDKTKNAVDNKKVKNYLKVLKKKYQRSMSLYKLRSKLGLSLGNTSLLTKPNLLKATYLPISVRKKIKNSLLLRVIFKYIQKLVKVRRRVNKKLIKLIDKLRSNSRRRFRAKERKLKHLNYVRLFSYTLKTRYKSLYNLSLKITKYYLIRRSKRLSRNPEKFYQFKKSKLPIMIPLKKFKHKVSAVNRERYRNRQRPFKNISINRSQDKYKNRNSRVYKLHKRKVKYDMNLIHCKKYLLKHLYSHLNYNLNTFKAKLLNLLIVNDKSRFLLIQRNTRILKNYLSILKKYTTKQFYNNLYHLKRSRYRIRYRFKNKYDYLSVDPFSVRTNYFSKKGKSFNSMKTYINTKKLINHLSVNLDKLKNSAEIKVLLKPILKKEIHFTNKSHNLYLILFMIKVMINNNLSTYNYLNQNLESIQIATNNYKENLNFNYIFRNHNYQNKLYRSYYNYKLRTRMKIYRARYHYKSLLKFMTLNDNKLFHNLGFLKRLFTKISNHLRFLFVSLYSVSNDKLKRHSIFNTNKKTLCLFSTKKKNLNVFKLKTLTDYNVPLHTKVSAISQKIVNNRRLKNNYNKVVNAIVKYLKCNNLRGKHRTVFKNILLNSQYTINKIITGKPMNVGMQSNITIRSTIESLLSTLIIESINGSFDTRNRLQQFNLGLKDKKQLLHPKFSPINYNMERFKHYLHSKYPTNRYNRTYSDQLDEKISHTYLTRKEGLFQYDYSTLILVRYINLINTLYNKVFNNLYSKFSFFNTVCNISLKENLNLYKRNYQYLFKNHYFLLNCLKSIIKGVYSYINSNVFFNFVQYFKNNTMIKAYNILENKVTNSVYTWKTYSYFNLKQLLCNSLVKKLYSYNSTTNAKNNETYNISFADKQQLISSNLTNEPLNSLRSIGSYMNEEMINYLQLNYVMEYDVNKLVSSKENFLYFYNLYGYNYDYNCMFILNPRLLCDYFVYAIKNKVQYYEIFADLREAFSDLRRLQIIMKKIYDRILYKFLHYYIDTMTDWYYLKIKLNTNTMHQREYNFFLKKLKRFSTLFSYLIYLIGIRNHINICGLHIKTGGRRSRKLRTHTRLYQRGKMSLNTFSDEIDYYFKPVMSRFGTLGLKVFIYREPCYRIPLLQIMYETLFLRFKLLRSLLTEVTDNNAKH